MNLNYVYNPTTKLVTNIYGRNNRINEDYSYVYEYDSRKRISAKKEYTGKAFYQYNVTRDDFGRRHAMHIPNLIQ